MAARGRRDQPLLHSGVIARVVKIGPRASPPWPERKLEPDNSFRSRPREMVRELLEATGVVLDRVECAR